jgi:hypothetical protein
MIVCPFVLFLLAIVLSVLHLLAIVLSVLHLLAIVLSVLRFRDRCGRDRMEVELTITCAISAHHH